MKNKQFLLVLLALLFTTANFAQDRRKVSGVVRDESGLGLSGATITEKGTNNKVQSDGVGAFFNYGAFYCYARNQLMLGLPPGRSRQQKQLSRLCLRRASKLLMRWSLPASAFESRPGNFLILFLK